MRVSAVHYGSRAACPAPRSVPLRVSSAAAGPKVLGNRVVYQVQRAVSLPAPAKLVKPDRRQAIKTQAAANDAPIAETPQGNSTFMQAVFNLVNIMMGIGLLTLPFALKSSGWIGIVLLWIMGFVTNYTGKALVDCANAIQERSGSQKKVGYEEIAEAAFGTIGRLIVSSIIYIELFGTCAILLVCEGDNLFNILGATAAAANSAGYMLLAALVVIPTLWLPDLRSLSPLGAAGLSATVCVTSAVIYNLVTGNFPGGVTTLADWSTLPLLFGIMTFCYSGHGVFPSIQASMKEPKLFPKVLDTAFLIVATLCTLMGAAGYYMYGSNACDLIVFNLPKGIIASICGCLILVNPVAKFALTLEPVSAAVQNAASATAGFKRLVVRTAVGLAVLLAARSIPFLALLMSFIGSLMTISVSVTFPALCHQKLLGDKLTAGQRYWDYLVAVLGATMSVVGTAGTVKSVMAKLAASSA